MSKAKKQKIDSLIQFKKSCDSLDIAYQEYQKKLKIEREKRRTQIEEKITENLDIPFEDVAFYTFNVDRFTIINADKFYKGNNRNLALNIKYDYENTEIKLIFKNINSMLNPIGQSHEKKEVYFKSLPQGEPFYILAICKMNNSVYFLKKEFVCEFESVTLNLEMQEISVQELIDELNKFNSFDK